MFVLWVIHYKCGLNKKCLFRHVSVKQRVIIPPLSLFQWTNGTTSSWSERKPVRPDNCLLPSNFFAYINILLHILAFLYTQSLSCPHMWIASLSVCAVCIPSQLQPPAETEWGKWKSLSSFLRELTLDAHLQFYCWVFQLFFERIFSSQPVDREATGHKTWFNGKQIGDSRRLKRSGARNYSV